MWEGPTTIFLGETCSFLKKLVDDLDEIIVKSVLV